jgi:hypothetical protein
MTAKATLLDEVLVASTFDESMINAQKVNGTQTQARRTKKKSAKTTTRNTIT